MIKMEVLTTSLGCAKCHRAMGIINSVVKKYRGKIKVVETDIMKHPDKLLKFNVMTTPAIIINGKLAFEGTPNEKTLSKKIDALLK